jgi:microsomal dipeptidase-like Zn-dependent dipeptidase
MLPAAEDEAGRGIELADRLVDDVEALVGALNAFGIIVDVSHVSENVSWQIVDLSASSPHRNRTRPRGIPRSGGSRIAH